MKNLLYVLTLGLMLTLALNSCSKKDPCEGIICQNNGTCEDGDCKCPAGFEGNFCENESLPKSITVTNIKVLKVPVNKTDGTKWDTDGNPDIYPVIFTLKTDNKTVDATFWSSELVKLNATTTGTHEFSIVLPKCSITPVDKTYAMYLMDKDDAGLEAMGGLLFNLKDFIKGRPSTIKLDCSTCSVAFELKVEYVF